MEANKDPKKILWIVPGNQEHDAMLGMCSDIFVPQLRSLWPDCDNMLYTNTKQVSDWPGSTYRVIIPKDEKKNARAEVAREIFLAAYVNGHIHEADVIICTEMTPTIMSYVMDFEGKIRSGIRLRRKPVIYLCPKLPEKGYQDITTGYGHQVLWFLFADTPNVWLAILDNDHEVEYAVKELHKRQPNASTKKILPKLICTKFEGFKDQGAEKEDLIMWQGRNNQAKRIDLASQIFAILSGQGYNCEMFVPSSTISAEEFITHDMFPVHRHMDGDTYRRNILRGKVCIICSESECWPPGYFEMIERGLVPVIKRQPWMSTFVTDHWPLVWSKPEEAVELCKIALRDYDKYRKMLEECLYERWSADLNFDQVMKHVWDQYIVASEREYSMEGK